MSEALRGLPRVNPATVARVRQAAEAAGYKGNPLTTALMSQLRRSGEASFHGSLALVEVENDGRPSYTRRYLENMGQAARGRARELGFGAERIMVSDTGVTVRRLGSILQARGIHGVIFLPCWGEPNFEALDWPRFAGIYTDTVIHHPPLNTVCPDHHRNMVTALERIHAAGFRRPGLVISNHIDERLQRRWEGAFHAGQKDPDRAVAPLRSKHIAMEEGEFRAWFRAQRPDVVIGHWSRVIPWMEAEGASLPTTHGFVCLNMLMAEVPCAGLDLQPEVIGRRSAETVIANLQQNAFGVPTTSTVLNVAGKWTDGPTLTPRGQ